MKEFMSIMGIEKMTVKQHLVVLWVVLSLVLATGECEHWWMYVITIASLVASQIVAGKVLKNLDIQE